MTRVQAVDYLLEGFSGSWYICGTVFGGLEFRENITEMRPNFYRK